MRLTCYFRRDLVVLEWLISQDLICVSVRTWGDTWSRLVKMGTIICFCGSSGQLLASGWDQQSH